MTVLDDRYGDTWSVLASDPDTGRHDFLRPRDGATLHVNPSGVTLTYPPSSPVYVTTEDPMGWLAETFGFPKMNLGDLEAIRRRERLKIAYDDGWFEQRGEMVGL